jgi:hypothetical protein
MPLLVLVKPLHPSAHYVLNYIIFPSLKLETKLAGFSSYKYGKNSSVSRKRKERPHMPFENDHIDPFPFFLSSISRRTTLLPLHRGLIRLCDPDDIFGMRFLQVMSGFQK